MEREGPLKNLEGDWTNVWSVTFHMGQVDFFTTSGVEPDNLTLLVGSSFVTTKLYQQPLLLSSPRIEIGVVIFQPSEITLNQY